MSEVQRFPFIRLPGALQLDILECLEADEAALHSAVLVSKAWYQMAIALLWKRPRNPYRALASLPGSRRQFYADKIRFLTETKLDEDYIWSILSTEFPNIQEISFRARLSPQRLVRCLHPNLRSVELHSAAVVKETDLELIRGRCPRLQTFKLEGLPHVSVQSFVRFMQKCRSLRNVEFSWGYTQVEVGQIFVYLASRNIQETIHIAERLEKLVLPSDLMFERATDADPRAISPTWLSPWGSSEAFSRFFEWCTSLRTLELRSSTDSTISA